MAFNLGTCEKCGNELDAAKLKTYKNKTICPACLKKAKRASRVACGQCGRKYSPKSLKNGLCKSCRESAKTLPVEPKLNSIPKAELRTLLEEFTTKEIIPLYEQIRAIEGSLATLKAVVDAQATTLSGTLAGVLDAHLARYQSQIELFRQKSIAIPNMADVHPISQTTIKPMPFNREKFLPSPGSILPRFSPEHIIEHDFPVFATIHGKLVRIPGFLPKMSKYRSGLPLPPTEILTQIFQEHLPEKRILDAYERFPMRTFPITDLVERTSIIINWKVVWDIVVDEQFRGWIFNSKLLQILILQAWMTYLGKIGLQLDPHAPEAQFIVSTASQILDRIHADLVEKNSAENTGERPIFDDLMFGSANPAPDYGLLATSAFAQRGLGFHTSSKIVDSIFKDNPLLARLVLAPSPLEGPSFSKNLDELIHWIDPTKGRTYRQAKIEPLLQGLDLSRSNQVKEALRYRNRFVEWFSRPDERRYSSPHDATFIKISSSRRRGAKKYLPRPTIIQIPRILVDNWPSPFVELAAIPYSELKVQYLDQFLF